MKIDFIHNGFVYESHFSIFLWKIFFTILTIQTKSVLKVVKNNFQKKDE